MMTAKNFRSIRKAQGLTQEGLALLLDVSSRTVQRYEAEGKRTQGPVVQVMLALAKKRAPIPRP